MTPLRNRLSGHFLLAFPAIFWLAVFFILPLLIVLGVSFLTRGQGGQGVLPLTLEHYDRTLNVFSPVLVRSLWLSLLTTVICLLAGYPLAFFISTRRLTWVRNVSLFLVILPFWTNFLVRTYAWRVLLGKAGVINEVLLNWGLIQEPLQLLNTEFAVLLGLVYGFLPFMVLPIYASVERFDFRFVDAAHDLGANDWRTFWRIVLPMTLPGVFAGCALVFIPAVGAFITPDLLGGTRGLMIGNLIQRQFRGTGNMPLGSAMSIVMMAIVMIALLVYIRLGSGQVATTSHPGFLSRLWGRGFRFNIGILSTWREWFDNLNFWTMIFALVLLLVFLGQLSLLALPLLIGAIIGGMSGLYGLLRDRFSKVAGYAALIGGLVALVYHVAAQATGATASFGYWVSLFASITLIIRGLSPRQALRRDMMLRRGGKFGLYFNPIISYFFLWAPILILILFSFNASRSLARWDGFTLQWYNNIFNDIVGADASFSTQQMLEKLGNSLFVSITATAIATTIGTMVALALERGNFPGKRFLEGVLFLPVVIPEITQGVSLAVFFNIVFNWWNGVTGQRVFPGFHTIIIAHVAFNISFVAIVVRARLADMNPNLEEAARDLGANEWRTFWRITFPLILPGIIAGALLAFTLSLDDFVVTFFTSGPGTTTLPIFVYGLLKLTVTPEINAISTLMLMASTVLIAISLALQGRNASRA